MKLGTETGSVINHVMAGASGKDIQVGQGCTILMWTDRRAGTVVKVTPCQVHVQEDKATRVDSNGMSESQEYVYERDPTAPVRVFRKTKRGWNCEKMSLMIGQRYAYHDFSF